MPDKIAQIGRQAALAAGAVMRQNYQQPHQITMKGAIDPVTETDYQCQEIIMGMIRRAFPDHGFLAERAGEGDVGQPPSAAAEAGHPGLAWEAEAPPACRWIIDPLDGTVNFAHGFPHVLRFHRLGGGRRPGVRGDLRPPAGRALRGAKRGGGQPQRPTHPGLRDGTAGAGPHCHGFPL